MVGGGHVGAQRDDGRDSKGEGHPFGFAQGRLLPLSTFPLLVQRERDRPRRSAAREGRPGVGPCMRVGRAVRCWVLGQEAKLLPYERRTAGGAPFGRLRTGSGPALQEAAVPPAQVGNLCHQGGERPAGPNPFGPGMPRRACFGCLRMTAWGATEARDDTLHRLQRGAETRDGTLHRFQGGRETRSASLRAGSSPLEDPPPLRRENPRGRLWLFPTLPRPFEDPPPGSAQAELAR